MADQYGSITADTVAWEPEKNSSSNTSTGATLLDANAQILTKRYLTTKDAYVTGFFFSTIDNIPPGFTKYMRENYSGGWDDDKIVKVFTSMALDIVLPQETLKTTTFPGRAGFSRTSPLFSQTGNAVSINFLVDQKLESSILLTGWYDYITKTADGRLPSNDQVNTTNIYGCNFYYCTLLPNMRDIVFAFAGEGFFPITNPVENFSHSLNTNDSLRHTISFNLDYYEAWMVGQHHTEWIKNLVLGHIERYSKNLYLTMDNAPQEEAIAISNESRFSYEASLEKPTGFSQPATDRYGNKLNVAGNDGSVHDKFNYAYS